LKRRSVLIVIASKDFNETEFLTVKNELLKNGIAVFVASDSHGLCTGDKGMKIKADVHFYNMNHRNFDAIILIGGKGIINYLGNEILLKTIRSFFNDKKITASICAAGLVLAKANILTDAFITGYTDIKTEIEKYGVNYVDEPVVIHKNIITGKGPSEALEFSNALVNALK